MCGHADVMLLLLLLAHLCFSSGGLLDETSRHGGADREALEETSHCVTETQRHQLLQEREEECRSVTKALNRQS